MNVLPLIFTFLVILACTCSVFFREVKSFALIETSLEGYSRTKRVVMNKLVSKAYQKIKTQPQVKKETKKSTKRGKYTSRRSFFPPFENAKFNLAALLKETGNWKLHPLYEVLASLLRTLYGDSLLKEEKLEYLLIDEMLKKASKLSETPNLFEFYPDDPKLSQLYYKMLKGTNQYSEKGGIAPLSDFLRFDKDAKAVNLSFAAPEILEALFDQETANEILKKERKEWESSNKYYVFSKEDLQTLLMQDPSKSSKLSILDSHLDYAKNFVPRECIGGRDLYTGIGVEVSTMD